MDLDLKHIESFAENSISEVFENNSNIEKGDYANIMENLSLIDSESAKKVEAIYKVLSIMSKRDKNNGKKN